jgi:Ser/Thr protein kinase RdoA (MazF antagonist)
MGWPALMSTEAEAADYYQLHPDRILDAIESVGLFPESGLLALNSYENRVYQFRDDEQQRWVVKFYRPQRWPDEAIIEEHSFCQTLHDNELPIVIPHAIDGKTLHYYDGYRFSLYPSQGGRHDDLNPEKLRQMGRLLGQLHRIGEAESYQHRPELNPTTFGAQSLRQLKSCPQIPPHIEQAYLAVAEQVVEQVDAIWSDIRPQPLVRLHGDCHSGNILWVDDQPCLLDFDDSRMGPAVQDIWMFLSGDVEETRQQLELLQEGYQTFNRFPQSHLRLIEPLRALRMLHHTAWIAKRWEDPAFPQAFGWFDSAGYWETQVNGLKEQLSILQQPCPYIDEWW